MFFATRPADFCSDRAGTICFIEHEGEFLLLKRAPHSYEGNRWTGAPGGKMEPGETPLEGALREVREETGVILPTATFIQTVYFRFDGHFEYALHLFHTRLKEKPIVHIDYNEHTEYQWATLQDALKMPIMQSGEECIQFVLKWLTRQGR
jgi:8-oxo-dGTP pyrophosphatase MutT (NUDIX family)